MIIFIVLFIFFSCVLVILCFLLFKTTVVCAVLLFGPPCMRFTVLLMILTMTTINFANLSGLFVVGWLIRFR